jgi:hypothetical protein
MKNTLRILVILLFSVILFQNCQKSDFTVITGVVRDSITNQPLEGAYVLSGNGISVTANDGTFSIDGLRTGKNEMSVHYFNGYEPLSKSIIITEGRVNKFDFNLSKITPPDIQTGKIAVLTGTSITITGSINLKTGLSVSDYGHCWSTSTPFPTVENSLNRTSNGYTSGQVPFTSTISGIPPDAVYYIRAYALTPNGIKYGNTVTFKRNSLSVDDDLLLYLPLNRDYRDASSNGNPYIWPWWNYPPFTTDRFGTPNNACQFSGSDNSPLYMYTYPFFNVLQDFSISFWFYKPTAWEHSTQKIFNLGYDSYLKAYIHQGAPPNNLIFGIRLGGTDYEVKYPDYPSADNWHHLVALRSGSEMKLYIDGTLAGGAPCDDSVISNYYYLFWGFGIWDYKPYKGNLDELRLYSRALSSSDIQYLATH